MPYYPASSGTNYQPYLGKTALVGGNANGPTLFDPTSTNWYDNGWWGIEYSNGASVLTGGGRSTTPPWIVSQMDALLDHDNVPAQWMLGAIYVNVKDDAGHNLAPFTYEASLDLVTPANDYSTLTMKAMASQTPPILDLLDSTGASRFTVTPTGGVISKPITSGALPTVAPSSGTALQISTAREVNLWVPVTYNPGAATTATCKVELSPDNVTFSTLSTETHPVGTVFDGTIRSLALRVPAAWYVKLTVTNATLGTGTYW